MNINNHTKKIFLLVSLSGCAEIINQNFMEEKEKNSESEKNNIENNTNKILSKKSESIKNHKRSNSCDYTGNNKHNNTQTNQQNYKINVPLKVNINNQKSQISNTDTNIENEKFSTNKILKKINDQNDQINRLANTLDSLVKQNETTHSHKNFLQYNNNSTITKFSPEKSNFLNEKSEEENHRSFNAKNKKNNKTKYSNSKISNQNEKSYRTNNKNMHGEDEKFKEYEKNNFEEKNTENIRYCNNIKSKTVSKQNESYCPSPNNYQSSFNRTFKKKDTGNVEIKYGNTSNDRYNEKNNAEDIKNSSNKKKDNVVLTFLLSQCMEVNETSHENENEVEYYEDKQYYDEESNSENSNKNNRPKYKKKNDDDDEYMYNYNENSKANLNENYYNENEKIESFETEFKNESVKNHMKKENNSENLSPIVMAFLDMRKYITEQQFTHKLPNNVDDPEFYLYEIFKGVKGLHNQEIVANCKNKKCEKTMKYKYPFIKDCTEVDQKEENISGNVEAFVNTVTKSKKSNKRLFLKDTDKEKNGGGLNLNYIINNPTLKEKCDCKSKFDYKYHPNVDVNNFFLFYAPNLKVSIKNLENYKIVKIVDKLFVLAAIVFLNQYEDGGQYEFSPYYSNNINAFPIRPFLFLYRRLEALKVTYDILPEEMEKILNPIAPKYHLSKTSQGITKDFGKIPFELYSLSDLFSPECLKKAICMKKIFCNKESPFEVNVECNDDVSPEEINNILKKDAKEKVQFGYNYLFNKKKTNLTNLPTLLQAMLIIRFYLQNINSSHEEIKISSFKLLDTWILTSTENKDKKKYALFFELSPKGLTINVKLEDLIDESALSLLDVFSLGDIERYGLQEESRIKRLCKIFFNCFCCCS